MKEATPFGRFCRELRARNNEVLQHMADKLNVSKAFLSSVELGRRTIPKSWEDILIKEYSLNDEQIKYLHQTIKDSTRSIKIYLQDKDNIDKELILLLYKKLDSLDIKEKELILSILKGE